MNDFWPGAGCAYGPILQPLTPFKSKLLVLRGIDIKSAMKSPIPPDHLPDYNNALTARQPNFNTPSGISVDQHIANAIGGQTKVRSLELGVGRGPSPHPICSSGAKGALPHEYNPVTVFTRLFAGAVGGSTELARIALERRSVLDTVGQEIAALRCELGAEARTGLDSHLTALRELERSINFVPGPATCPSPATPPSTGIVDSNLPPLTRQQMDLAVAAFRCDRTRVITILYPGVSSVAHTWRGINYSHHQITHRDASLPAATPFDAYLTRIENWYAEQFAYLCTKLNEIPEGNGTMLDNSLLVWVHEQSNGRNHQRTDMPYVLAGSCGGYFRTGRCIQFPGVAHNNLLMSLANAMGVETKTFGDPEFSQGPISALR